MSRLKPDSTLCPVRPSHRASSCVSDCRVELLDYNGSTTLGIVDDKEGKETKL